MTMLGESGFPCLACLGWAHAGSALGALFHQDLSFHWPRQCADPSEVARWQPVGAGESFPLR